MSTPTNGKGPGSQLRIHTLKIQGFRALRDCDATLGPLEVIAGANGSGKTSLFDFLKLLRDTMLRGRIANEVIDGAIGVKVFHRPGKDELLWRLDLAGEERPGFSYSGGIVGPLGAASVVGDTLVHWRDPAVLPGRETLLEPADQEPLKYNLMTVGPDGQLLRQSSLRMQRTSLALAASHPAQFREVLDVQGTIQRWRFYSGLNAEINLLRQHALVEEEPTLQENLANLGAVLHHLKLEHRDRFEELQTHLRGVVPGFRSMTVKVRGRGRVEVLWQEDGWKEPELSLSDLSDGTIRLIAWLTLALSPDPPPLVCIDEPEEGVHPRTLPKLAGLFSKLAERTQVLLATHSSYFLLQFPLERIAVMRKVDGGGVFRKPADSKALCECLEDFGDEELEVMHRSGELEQLP